MALKRTLAPFYGKRESRAAADARAAFHRGDTDGANRIHAAIGRSREIRYERHLANGGRKVCRSAGR